MFAIRPAAIIACAIGALISTAALPFDNGQWNDGGVGQAANPHESERAVAFPGSS
jgi:hypothetical protein